MILPPRILRFFWFFDQDPKITFIDLVAALLGNHWQIHNRPPLVLGLGVFRCQARRPIQLAPLNREDHRLRFLDRLVRLLASRYEYIYKVAGSD